MNEFVGGPSFANYTSFHLFTDLVVILQGNLAKKDSQTGATTVLVTIIVGRFAAKFGQEISDSFYD